MAATTTIREFLVGLGFDVDEASFAKFQSSLVTATAGAVALGAAVVGAAGAIVAAVKSVASEYDELDKLATRFRSTVDAVDEFNDVAGLLGLSDEQAIGSLTRLDRAIGDTALGLGRAKKVFEEIGLEVLDASGKMRSTTDVMDDLSVKLREMERGKAIAVMERLGLDPALLKVFNADLGQLREDLAAIDKAAGFDLTEAVASSKTFIKSWKALQVEIAKTRLVFSKAYEALAVKLMPQIGRAVDDVRRMLETSRKYIMEAMGGVLAILERVIGVLLGTFSGAWQLVGRVFEVVVAFVKLVISALQSLGLTTEDMVRLAYALGAAWLYVNRAFLASPVTWVLALAAALLLLYDDFQTWKEGGTSLIDWNAWTAEIAIVTGLIEQFRDLLTQAFTLIAAGVDTLARLLRGDFAGAWTAVGAAIEAVLGIFSTAYGWVTKLIDGIATLSGFKGVSFTAAAGQRLQAAADATFATAQYDAAGNFQGGSPAFDMNQGVQQSVSQTTTIQVQGSADPGATGRAVAGEQGRVNADMTRNLKGSVR